LPISKRKNRPKAEIRPPVNAPPTRGHEHGPARAESALKARNDKPAGDDSYASGTHSHRSRLLRFSHRRRFDHAAKLLDPHPDSRVLDYGSGDGYLLERLLPVVPAGHLTAYEPLDYLQEQIKGRFAGQPVALVTNLSDLASRRFDRIACLEVLEHLQPDIVTRTLDTLETILAPGGAIVISVPVEVGPTVLLKYLASRIQKGSTRHMSWSEVLKASFYGSVPRDTEHDFIPHKGFDYCQLRSMLRERFVIERQVFSPVPLLGGLLNAQVLWRMRSRGSGSE